MEKQPVLFLSCGIFREELDYLARGGSLGAEVVYLDAALHVNFDRLKQHLIEALQERSKEGLEIKVLYGHCHPEIAEIMDRYGARRIDAGNCLEAIVGREEILRIDAEAKTFFLTSGWINNWERMFAIGKEDLHLDFSTLFSQYKRIMVFETGVIPVDERKIEQFSMLTGLPVERKRIDLVRFRDLITRT